MGHALQLRRTERNVVSEIRSPEQNRTERNEAHAEHITTGCLFNSWICWLAGCMGGWQRCYFYVLWNVARSTILVYLYRAYRYWAGLQLSWYSQVKNQRHQQQLFPLALSQLLASSPPAWIDLACLTVVYTTLNIFIAQCVSLDIPSLVQLYP